MLRCVSVSVADEIAVVIRFFWYLWELRFDWYSDHFRANRAIIFLLFVFVPFRFHSHSILPVVYKFASKGIKKVPSKFDPFKYDCINPIS